MKKSTTTEKKVRPTKIRNPVVAGRVHGPLYERLKRAVAASGRSMSEELAWRAEQSFLSEDALGSPDMRDVVAIMVAAFAAAGKTAAYSRGIRQDWLRDRECFLRAVFGVAENLMVAVPDCPPDPKEADELVSLLAQSLRSRLATHWARRELKKEGRP